MDIFTILPYILGIKCVSLIWMKNWFINLIEYIKLPQTFDVFWNFLRATILREITISEFNARKNGKI